jgi:acid phosphatase
MKKLFISIFILSVTGSVHAQDFFTLVQTKAVIEYYESGAWEKEIEGVVEDAMRFVNGLRIDATPTAVFDIDETCMSNYQLFKELNFILTDSAWNAWVAAERSTAILPMKRFYDHLLSRNFQIIFLTGRDENSYQSTYNNLMKEGFTIFDTLICKSSDIFHSTAAEFKSVERKKLVERGYNIQINSGDQWSDLVGGNANLLIRIPNYLYVIR